ncbi:MAG: ROK family protein [Pyrinomonadaceae bacterium MAG19_C2-C3]|nr:ROK family protein [Pyrinomonadaceae bacterium MAG19_C2-C3]
MAETHKSKALAVDLGGSHATCAVVAGASVIASETLHINGAMKLFDVLPRIANELRRLTHLTEVGFSECVGIAFGFPGIVNTQNGRVLSTNQKFVDATELDLPGWARESFNLKLRIENDARLALLGEQFAGAAKNFTDIVMITLGTGIGGAAMIEGRLVRGKHFQAGCLGGHLPVQLNGRKCNCGNIGCVEAEASTWALPQICREQKGFNESSLAQVSIIDFATLSEHAAEGDAVANAVWQHCLNVWAAGAVAMIHAYDPEVLVIGGGVMKNAARVLPFIQTHIKAHAWTMWGDVAVRAAHLGNHAALIGALPLLRENVAGEKV